MQVAGIVEYAEYERQGSHAAVGKVAVIAADRLVNNVLGSVAV